LSKDQLTSASVKDWNKNFVAWYHHRIPGAKFTKFWI